MGSEGGQDSGLGLGGGRVETKREEGKGRRKRKLHMFCPGKGNRSVCACLFLSFLLFF